MSPGKKPGFLSPTAPLSLSTRFTSDEFCARDADEVEDRVLAGLVKKRLALERVQGWTVLGLFASALLAVVALGTHLGSQVLLGITAAVTASLAVGLGFCVDRLFWAIFLEEGRAQGLSEKACRRVFERAAGAEKVIEVLRSCGKEPSDQEIATFVR